MEVSLIFPHQLFQQHPAIAAGRPIVVAEEWLYFHQYAFHKQKLVLHRASMQFYLDYLRGRQFSVDYIEATEPTCDVRQLVPYLQGKGITAIHIASLTDDWLHRRLLKAGSKAGIAIIVHNTPAFINTTKTAGAFFDSRRNYFQTDFYIDQRKKRRLLLDAAGKPLGGKWTYDTENRLKLPKGEHIPTPVFPRHCSYTVEACTWVNTHFSNNPGTTDSPFKPGMPATSYPATFEQAEAWLDDFMAHRFARFGVYEDAMVAKEHVLFHSVLTPMLNIGLLTPQQVLDKALDAATLYNIPLNSLEGFVRQITGWREFIRIVYEREGHIQRTRNYWGFTRKIPPAFWNGTTGIVPVDTVIRKVLQSGYAHHIERLMVLGNFMLLCEFDPDEVYRWFMALFIDAYDWVMVPNVYGMTQFADGGLMTTKPYISGSNYLMKMGDWQKGPWQQTWDGLFWRFMHVHRDFFSQNPRMGMLLKTLDKMPAAKQQQHLSVAEQFLHLLDTSL